MPPVVSRPAPAPVEPRCRGPHPCPRVFTVGWGGAVTAWHVPNPTASVSASPGHLPSPSQPGLPWLTPIGDRPSGHPPRHHPVPTHCWFEHLCRWCRCHTMRRQLGRRRPWLEATYLGLAAAAAAAATTAAASAGPASSSVAEGHSGEGHPFVDPGTERTRNAAGRHQSSSGDDGGSARSKESSRHINPRRGARRVAHAWHGAVLTTRRRTVTLGGPALRRPRLLRLGHPRRLGAGLLVCRLGAARAACFFHSSAESERRHGRVI